jgi:hypothetical protein
MKKTLLSFLVAVGLIFSASADVFTESFSVNPNLYDGYSIFGIGNAGQWGGNDAGTNYNWVINICPSGYSNSGEPNYIPSWNGFQYLQAYAYATNGDGFQMGSSYLNFGSPVSFGSLVNSNTSFSLNPSTTFSSPFGAIYLPFNTFQGYYGWLQINDNGASSNPTFQITYAFDDTGAPIQVGSTTAFTAAPEPSTYALFGLGVLALVIVYRRKVA